MALPPTYKTRLSQKVILTHDTRDFYFDLLEPPTIEFSAGQFVLVKANHPEMGELISRAYSLVNAPSENRFIRLCLNIVPGGKLTPLMERWEIGHEGEIQGPFGHFTLKSGPDRELVFVATGTGIAPFHSMITDLLGNGDGRRMALYFGVRHETDVYYREEFEKLAGEHPNFKFVLTLSQPRDDWTGSRGRVTAALTHVEVDVAKTDVYLCGGKPMIDDVKKIFIEKGLQESQIYFEQYFLK